MSARLAWIVVATVVVAGLITQPAWAEWGCSESNRPGMSSGSSAHYISRVQVADLDKSSGLTTGLYCDFSATNTVNMEEGGSYPITVNVAGNWLSDLRVRVFVDWNHSGNVPGAFDDAGESYDLSGTSTVRTGTITVPGGATLGTTRMRVFAWINTMGAVYPGSCYRGYWLPGAEFYGGEAEDYTLELASAGYCDVSPAVEYCTGGMEHITRVQVGAIDNSTSATQPPCQSDHTAQSTNMVQSQSYPITVTVDSSIGCSSSDKVIVFVDWNQDGDWTTGMRVSN